MKILIVRNAYEYDFGGAERLAAHMAEELIANEHDVILVSNQKKLQEYAGQNSISTKKAWWWSRQNWSGWRVALFPFYIAWQCVLYFWYLHLFSQHKPDVVHLFSKDDFIAATIAARTLEIKVVWTDCADLKYVLANHAIWYKNPVGKLVFQASRYAAAITLVSRSEKVLIEQALSRPTPANFKVVHIAGRDESVKPIARTAEDMNAVIFTSTSRLVVAKGISELIAAFNQLTENNDTYRLWLIGEGPDQERFKQEAGNNASIQFFGHQASPLQYVAAGDIFVQPTYHEGFSLSLAEAAMLGKPMIATKVGGNPELVNEHNGMLVKVRSVDELYTAMKALGEDRPLQKKLGTQARDDYKNNFDFSKIVKQEFLPLYEKNTH